MPRFRLLRLFPCLLLGACASAPDIPRGEALLVEDSVSAPAPMPRPARTLDDDGIFYIQGDDPAHPRVRYLDGQVALDSSCAIQIGNKLNRKIPPVYVNGQPIGFC